VRPGPDNSATSHLGQKARRVVFIQLVVTLVVAALFLGQGILLDPGQNIGQGMWGALSAAYGGLVSVVLALISIRGFKRANELALRDPQKGMLILYIGAVIRFVAVLILLGIGLGLFQLAPLAVIIGFVLAQASYLMGARDKPRASQP